MHRKREFSYASAPERFRPAMREAFPPLLDIPAAMRAVLAELDGRVKQDRHAASVQLAADEKRDAEATSRTIT